MKSVNLIQKKPGLRVRALLLALAMLFSVVISAQKKIALVIGNAHYTGAPLRNPVNDATLVAGTLRSLGFTVILKTDLNRQQMEDAVRSFSGRLLSGDIALFYYSGHGLQVKGINYLIPVGENIATEVEIPYKSMEAQFVTDYLQQKGTSVNIVILDACRNNPFAAFRSQGRGFVPVIAPQGTFIAYSTSPGSVASDGEGDHSPYTANLNRALQNPGMAIEEVFKEVRRNVMKETGKQQVPWESSSLVDEFSFTGQVKAAEKTNNPTPPVIIDKKPVARNEGPIEMVWVEGGTFQMGSDDGENDEKPVHSVRLSGFYMGKTEVTQKQWRDVMGSDPERLYFKGCDNCPVENVSWNDVQEFIQKLNQKTGKTYRLPTEAEWEFAARGGNKSRGYQYSGSNDLDEVAWYKKNSDSKTHPVGQKPPNELGLYDMSGNVWEWCSDWYGNYASGSQENPVGPATGSYRVNRGGSWRYDPQFCRSSNRSSYNPDGRNFYLGFRLVLVP